MKYLFINLFPCIAIGLVLSSPVSAQTPDGETPFQETICDAELGEAFGLCNAYCEAMDCDSDDPQASDKACNRIFSHFENITGTIPPCENLCPCEGLTFNSPDGPITWGSGFNSLNCQNNNATDGSLFLQDTMGNFLVDFNSQICNFPESPVCGFAPIGSCAQVEFIELTLDEFDSCRASIVQIADQDGVICPN